MAVDQTAGVPDGWEVVTPSTAAPRESAASRFVEGATKNLNPMGAVNAVLHPVDTLKSIIDAHAQQIEKAKQAYADGRYSEAAGHLGAATLPLVGPAAANAGERIGSGDVAGGLGEATGLLASVEAPRAVGAIATKAAPLRAALHAPADAVLDAALKKTGVDPEALQLAATRMRLQAARSQTRQAQMSRQIAAAQAPEAAATASAVPAPAEAPPAAPPPQPGPRSVNNAMAEAVRQVQAQAKADRAAVTARGASAPGAPTPTVAPVTQSPPPPTPPTGSRPVPASGKPSVTAQMLTQYQKLRTLGLKDAEMPTYLRLTQQGTPEAEALQTIEAMRKLSAKLPSASDVARTIADRNRTGKWRE